MIVPPHIPGLLTSPVIALVIFAVSFLVVRFGLLPYLKVKSHKKAGVSTYFFPILGALHEMGKALKEKGDHMANLKEASKDHPNPKYHASHIKTNLFIFLQDPKYIKEFLQKQQYYKKIHFIDVLKPLIGNGLVSAEGDIWKRHRKIVSSSFNFEFLKMNMPVIQNTAKEFFDKMSETDYEDYSAISRIQDITGEIVGRIFFGEFLLNYTFEGKPLTLALAELTSDLGSTSMDLLVVFFGASVLKWSFIPRYRRILEKVHRFRQMCFQIIQDRKSKSSSGSTSTDLLSSLLATQKSEDVENRFSDEDIVDEFITFFIAGMDTTGHLIGMTLYNLAKYPDFLPKLKSEREATYDKERQITTDTLAKMDVLHAFFKETLRFYTPAPLVFLREVLQDHDLLDIKLKKGDYVNSAFMSNHFDERNFEKAWEFNPERWKAVEGKLDPYAYTPFSAGPRNCIGQHLAIMEAKVIVSEFLKRFDFEVKPGFELKMMFRFLYEPQNELLLNLAPNSTQKVN